MKSCSEYLAHIFKECEFKVYNTEASTKAINPVVVYTLKLISSNDYKNIYELDINIYSDKISETLDTSISISTILNSKTLGFYNNKSYRIFDVLVDEDIYIQEKNTNMKNVKATIHVI